MNVDNLNWTIEYYEENIEECNSLLNSLESFDKIPSINRESLQHFTDGALVRYYGMVQDMLSPEYYSSTYTIVNTRTKQTYTKSGNYRDITSCEVNEEFQENATAPPKERQVFFCIPIPGTNDWVENNLNLSVAKQMVLPINEPQSSGMKRGLGDDNEEMEVDGNTEKKTSLLHQKKSKTNQGENIDESQNNSYNIMNSFPFREIKGLPCLVKVCDEEGKMNIVLNDIIEVIGFLSLNPALEANWEDTDAEDKATHPPPSLVPRIHAIFIKKLHHCNPLLKQVIPYVDTLEFAKNARSDLHLILTQLLFEDSVAANFLICHLLSRVYIRNSGQALGKFSLNLYNIKLKNFSSCINNVLKILLTHSHYLDLSIECLNNSAFIPKKDYESNRLISGILQLCDGTHLILNETNMNEGQLKNQGCLNVLALQKLFREQEIQYDFGYYPISYETNIPILVLSEGKSMFEADVRFKVKSEMATESSLSESFQAVLAYLNDEVANKLRIYLTSMKYLNFEMGENMVKKIGEDYVSLRQQNEKINSSDLHTLLVLSRLLALSYGRTTLSEEDWSMALEMDKERKLRLN